MRALAVEADRFTASQVTHEMQRKWIIKHE